MVVAMMVRDRVADHTACDRSDRPAYDAACNSASDKPRFVRYSRAGDRQRRQHNSGPNHSINHANNPLEKDYARLSPLEDDWFRRIFCTGGQAQP
jgi:hypothetical protein